MVDLPTVKSVPLETIEAPQDRVSGGDVQRSGNYLAQGLGDVGKGLEDVSVPLASQAGQAAAEPGVVTRDANGTPQFSPPLAVLFGRGGDAYAAALQASTGVQMRSLADRDVADMRVAHEGDPAGFETAVDAYRKHIVANNPNPVGYALSDYLTSYAATQRNDLVSQKARADLAASSNAQADRLKYLSDQLDGLAAQGVSSGDVWDRLNGERKAIQDARSSNPLFRYSPEQREVDDARFQEQLQGSTIAGHYRREYMDTGNLGAVMAKAETEVQGLTGMSFSQKERVLGEITSHLRGLDAIRRMGTADLRDKAAGLAEASATGTHIPDEQFDDIAQQLRDAHDYVGASKVVTAQRMQRDRPALYGTASEATAAINGIKSDFARAMAGAADAGDVTGGGGDYAAAVRRIENPSGNPNAVSPSGAVGDYQFMPSTWSRWRRTLRFMRRAMLPVRSVAGGASARPTCTGVSP